MSSLPFPPRSPSPDLLIHTYEKLLITMHSLAHHPRPKLDASSVPFSIIEDTATDFAALRLQLEERLTDEDSRYSEDEFYLDILDRLTDIEEAGVEGWVRWLKTMLEDRKRRGGVMGLHNFEGDGHREDHRGRARERSTHDCGIHTGNRSPDATKKHDDMALPTIPFRVFENDAPPSYFGATGGDSLRNVVNLLSSPSSRSRSPSTVVEDGSYISEGNSQIRYPWNHPFHGLDEAYPPPLTPSTTGRPRSDGEEFSHLREERNWNREEADRMRDLSPSIYDRPRSSSPVRYNENNQRILPYIHVLLPPGFTLPNHDAHSCTITFKSPSSVFHFPLGATRDQLVSVLNYRRTEGRTLPDLAPGEDLNIMRMRTEGMEWELKNAIARGRDGNTWNGYGHDSDFTGLWRGEGRGDTYIVSGPDIHFHGLDSNEPRSENGESGEQAGAESESGEQEMPWMRGGNGTRSRSQKDVRGQPEHTDLRNQYESTCQEPFWKREAYILGFELDDLRCQYEQLRSAYGEARDSLESKEKRSRGIFRAMVYWIDEAREAKAREEALKEELAKQKDDYNQYRKRTEYAIATARKLIQYLDDGLHDDANDDTSSVCCGGSCGSRMRGGGFSQCSRTQHRQSKPDQVDTIRKAIRTPDATTTTNNNSSATIGLSENKQSNIRTNAATSFLFFPGVSTVALLSEPKYFFQWPYPVTLSDIRKFLQKRKKRNIKDDAELVRVREILEIRDEMGIPDPDTSNSSTVVIDLPTKPDAATTNELVKSIAARIPTNSHSGKKMQAGILEAVNLLRKDRGVSALDLNMDLGLDEYGVDSDDEDRFKDVGYLINALAGQIDLEDDYDSDYDSDYSSTSENVELRSREPSHKDTKLQRPSTPFPTPKSRISQLFHRGGSSAQALHPPNLNLHTTDPLLFNTSAVPSSPSEDTNLFRHSKNQGCESWTGFLSPHRDHCTYCHIPFLELEPHGPVYSDSSLGSESDSDSGDYPVPAPLSYAVRSSPKFDGFNFRSASKLDDGFNLELSPKSVEPIRCSPKPDDGFNFESAPKPESCESNSKNNSRGGPDEDYMTASYPFKICTNPYSVPPLFTRSEPDIHGAADSACRSRAGDEDPYTLSRCPSTPASLSSSVPRLECEGSSVSSPRMWYSCLASPGPENPTPERTSRDYYRRVAEEEEDSVEERINRIEGLVREMIQVTREVARKEELST